ncbi:hypothetical protein N9I92_00695, partial [bacterium]|nr:hypothetical protein [bacterium]
MSSTTRRILAQFTPCWALDHSAQKDDATLNTLSFQEIRQTNPAVPHQPKRSSKEKKRCESMRA